MRKRVLIVDDSRLARNMMKKAVKELAPDVEIEEAANVDEALELWRAQKPDIGLFDLNMPGRSGLDLAEEVVGDGVKLVLCTANVQDAVRARAAELGLAFVNKPITVEKLTPILTGL